MAAMLLAVSCGQGDSGEGEGGGTLPDGGEADKYADYLFSEQTPAAIITNDASATRVLGELYDLLCERVSKDTMLYQTDRVKNKGHEILVGMTNRPLSTVAYEKLGEVKKDNSLDVAYVIVSEGSSVAIAYDTEFSMLALKKAVSAIINEMIGDKRELKLDGGTLKSVSVSVIDYYSAEDESYKAEAWGALKEHLGEENEDLYNALRG